MTDYKASKRIVGTSSERESLATAVKFDAQGVSSDPSGSGATLTASLTIGNNSNRVLIVTAGSYNQSPTISGITWTPSGGSAEALTQSVTDITGSDGRSDLWYLINPTIGSGTVTCTWSSDAGVKRRVGGMSFYNVNQSSPIGVTNAVDGSGTTVSGTITPTTTGSAIVDSVMWLTGGGSETAEHTLGWKTLINGDRLHGSQYNLSPTINSANSMQYANGQSAGWAWVGVEIKCQNQVGIQTNSIFEDSTNGKHYIWSGSAWTEVA